MSSAKFHGNGGYRTERERASRIFEPGRVYRVTGGTMGRSHSELEIEGVDGLWNSALFDVNLAECPLVNTYLSITYPNLVGYDCLGWADRWNGEHLERVRAMTDDWRNVFSNDAGTLNVVASAKLRLYYQYETLVPNA
jgi:hypothetical protein